ncbi:MAG: hypothetical protein LBR53_10965 [Deltaproteobacteria bacterium]|jgi:hypothetical protein|nr:hypothetical protein [Deltaproteobacteria bacterium]
MNNNIFTSTPNGDNMKNILISIPTCVVLASVFIFHASLSAKSENDYILVWRSTAFVMSMKIMQYEFIADFSRFSDEVEDFTVETNYGAIKFESKPFASEACVPCFRGYLELNIIPEIFTVERATGKIGGEVKDLTKIVHANPWDNPPLVNRLFSYSRQPLELYEIERYIFNSGIYPGSENADLTALAISDLLKAAINSETYGMGLKIYNKDLIDYNPVMENYIALVSNGYEQGFEIINPNGEYDTENNEVLFSFTCSVEDFMHGPTCYNPVIKEMGVSRNIRDAYKTNPIFLKALKDNKGLPWNQIN